MIPGNGSIAGVLLERSRIGWLIDGSFALSRALTSGEGPGEGYR
jgi:hypothetical protein